MISSCIILAAGLGTRMRPLTNDRPKPMVQIIDQPIIAYVMDMCLEAGIDHIVMNYHYQAKLLIDYVQENYSHHHITLSDETELLLDSGGGILNALKHIQDDTFFVINADCIWAHTHKNALRQLYEAYNPEKFDLFKLLCEPKNATGFSESAIYRLDGANYIQKQDPNLLFTGIYIMKRHLFDGFDVKPFSVRENWQIAFDNHRVGGVPFQGDWLHIGTPDGVMQAEAVLKKRLKRAI